MSQFPTAFFNSPTFAAIQSETQSSDSIEIISPQSPDTVIDSWGLLILLSGLLLFGFSLSNWKPSTNRSHLPRRSSPSEKDPRLDEQLDKLPCTKCHYFKANMYLPCAVNPVQALTPEAINCSDFQLQKRKVDHEYCE
jgi:hypothetical protein